MKKSILLLSFILLAACSSPGQNAQQPPQPVPSADIQTVQALASYPFPLVKWNDRVYAITDTSVTEIDQEIGEITLQSNECIQGSPNNFSTTFKAGSKLYAIQGIPVEEAIAVRASEHEYIKVIAPATE
ncbi:hypothetical protein [Paenibacillus ihuae]|uniref:hypothetical protein n=1 Tax=Paenibacillus ihuae TaxID=1232431 RepID=UPI0006D55363|nr:hypothetical protein [Paenibacillus ihuae]